MKPSVIAPASLLLLLSATACVPAVGPLAALIGTKPTVAYATAKSGAEGTALQKAVLSQLQAFIASKHAEAKLSVAPESGWIELHNADGSDQILFDVMTTVQTTAQLQDKQAEFYGKFDTTTGKLVPQTLWIGAEAEATYTWLNQTR